ncbi:hypothetical protein CABS03_10665 [Colletotrichum abscissum]|uniref:Uncharacterized protein n=1 Tax=Colletotrichum abscissum TaxID=1671311 RepID=A0A9Q0AXX1_9PEZI|nr:hypothetical protein CABS02_13991 [Colletotrichum abscissum]
MTNPKRLGRDVQNTRSFSLGQRIADALGDNGDGEITTSYLARSEICIAEHSYWKSPQAEPPTGNHIEDKLPK